MENFVLPDSVSINLEITLRCNYRCAHCSVSAGPERPADYISSEVLDDIHRQILYTEARGVWIDDINLIGGEPTLNLREFARVCETVSQWGYRLMMTTNGWWLGSEKASQIFFDIASRYLDDGYGDTNFYIRISNDRWHDAFRPAWLRGQERLKRALLCRLDENAGRHPEILEYGDWIYVDWERRPSAVVPVGRGAAFGCFDKSGHCCPNNLVYGPNGAVVDFCCNGQIDEGFGTCKDDPLFLLYAFSRFLEEVRPNCTECGRRAVEWKLENMPQLRETYMSEFMQGDVYA